MKNLATFMCALAFLLSPVGLADCAVAKSADVPRASVQSQIASQKAATMVKLIPMDSRAFDLDQALVRAGLLSVKIPATACAMPRYQLTAKGQMVAAAGKWHRVTADFYVIPLGSLALDNIRSQRATTDASHRYVVAGYHLVPDKNATALLQYAPAEKWSIDNGMESGLTLADFAKSRTGTLLFIDLGDWKVVPPYTRVAMPTPCAKS